MLSKISANQLSQTASIASTSNVMNNMSIVTAQESAEQMQTRTIKLVVTTTNEFHASTIKNPLQQCPPMQISDVNGKDLTAYCEINQDTHLHWIRFIASVKATDNPIAPKAKEKIQRLVYHDTVFTQDAEPRVIGLIGEVTTANLYEDNVPIHTILQITCPKEQAIQSQACETVNGHYVHSIKKFAFIPIEINPIAQGAFAFRQHVAYAPLGSTSPPAGIKEQSQPSTSDSLFNPELSLPPKKTRSIQALKRKEQEEGEVLKKCSFPKGWDRMTEAKKNQYTDDIINCYLNYNATIKSLCSRHLINYENVNAILYSTLIPEKLRFINGTKLMTMPLPAFPSNLKPLSAYLADVLAEKKALGSRRRKKITYLNQFKGAIPKISNEKKRPVFSDPSASSQTSANSQIRLTERKPLISIRKHPIVAQLLEIPLSDEEISCATEHGPPI